MEHCGIDLAMKSSSICVTDSRGSILSEQLIETEEPSFRAVFGGRRKMQCVVEASPMAEWVASILESLGHEVVLIDVRKAKGVIRTKKKTDRLDARNLARMGRTGWYTKVHRKSAEARATRTFLVARHGLVQTAMAQNSRIRGLLRAQGLKLGEVKESEYASRVEELARSKSPDLWRMLDPLVAVRAQAMRSARQMERELLRQSRQDQVRKRLMTVPGVGALVATAYVATIDDPRRFSSSGRVGAYAGLAPSVTQSGEVDHHGHVTREGDGLLRSYLVEASHVLLTRKRGSCDLKRWGLKLARKKGMGKARVAVARKLAALLHHLWVTGESFHPKAA
jgi:transposase